MAELVDWYKSLPFFTRHWFGGSMALSLLGRFELIPVRTLTLNFDALFYQFQIWRPITALFMFPMSFQFLVYCYYLIKYSRLLETGIFQVVPADYAFMLLINWLLCVGIGLLLNLPVLMGCMVFSVVYVWCSQNKDATVQFFFGSQFKALYLPWVFFAMDFILLHDGTEALVGIFVGHVYTYFKFLHTRQYGGGQWLRTPKFLTDLFPPRRGASRFFSRSSDQPPRAEEHPWGRGHSLGGGDH